ncbi:MAG: GTPase Era [Gammaproteobacteria bacterium]|nr:GTPase Era [Gammaproteobacteria bacterium]MCW8840975.1 GTPase Era [Gammaproteobacteria bacterium]MCW8927440.1 GTPase Era [Gammaproteobacteria bacterium]MCW8958724.1 GTPase Era [Gammaproteobacteria bacterium]MCW8973258.1 GTPase Era [Gammaproteobacteria bacterium]
MNKENAPFRSGYVAIVGRPNVGKSTLMNHILGQKISITSNKPQTTRHRILGIKTEAGHQAIYVDTPGLHLNAKKAMNRYMNRAATTSLEGVDLILFVVDAARWTEEDDNVLERVAGQKTPVVLVVNKVDRIKDKSQLLPLLQKLSAKMDFAAVLPLSALKGTNVNDLEREVVKALPESEGIFPEEYITDRSERFLAAEIVREKLMRGMGKELPYATTVEIEQFKEEDGLIRINALIWVERASQKKIVIGSGGEQLKEIGKQARIDMERLFASKVFLQLWVKVKSGWSDNERILGSLGYKDEY